MKRKIFNKFTASILSSALIVSAVAAPVQLSQFSGFSVPVASSAADTITIDDMPAEFRDAADWIWQNRVEREQSTARRNTIFDQIVAGKGTLNYVVKWQSYKTVTYEQRKQFEKMLSDCVNGWCKWLSGYENWCYDTVEVKIVGWAVIDKSCLLDIHDDEVIYTDTRYYDSQYDTSNGREEIPDKEPYAPDMLSRLYHFENSNNPEFDAYNYPGGLDKRFDMCMWATQGFPDIGGCGGDWGQRLSDNAYIAMIDGSNIHVLEHEIGHGFGMTDFYGEEGAIDGFPPGGFPGGENSLMMAGSAAKITDFDGWFLRYMWTKIKDEEGRFDLADAQPVTTTTTAETTTEATTTTTVETTAETTTIVTDIPFETEVEFTAEIESVEFFGEDTYYFQKGYIGNVRFTDGRYYLICDGYSREDSTNLAYYETGDVVSVHFTILDVPEADSELKAIYRADRIELIQDVRETTEATTTATTTQTQNETTTAESTTEAETGILYGDANCDGKVNIADATAIIQSIANGDKYGLSEQGAKNADCDGQSGVTPLDAYAIQKLEAGIITSLPDVQ